MCSLLAHIHTSPWQAKWNVLLSNIRFPVLSVMGRLLKHLVIWSTVLLLIYWSFGLYAAFKVHHSSSQRLNKIIFLFKSLVDFHFDLSKTSEDTIMRTDFERKRCDKGNPVDICPVTSTVHTWRRPLAAVGVDKGCREVPACLSLGNAWYWLFCRAGQWLLLNNHESNCTACFSETRKNKTSFFKEVQSYSIIGDNSHLNRTLLDERWNFLKITRTGPVALF